MINRSIAPEITIPSNLKVKAARKHKTPKGVDIYSLEFNEYDVIRVSFVFRAGTKYQPKPFCSTSVSGMLTEGCKGSSAREISELLDFYGIYYDHTTDRDHSVLTICALERFFDIGLQLLDCIINYPVFPEDEFDIYRVKRKRTIEMQRAKIDFVAREEFAKLLFGERHHYGVSHCESYFDNLTTEDLRSYHKEYFTRSNLFVVTSGKTNEGHLTKIAEIADSLELGVKAKPFSVPITRGEDKFIKWEGATQSVIRMGRILFPRSHPDFVAVQVVAMILGGYFSSRLVSNLREEKGYTYGIFAAVINLEETGYMAISTEVDKSVTCCAINEIFIEIERLSNELISEDELVVVKRVMAGEMMRILDGPFGITDITIENVLTFRDNSFINSCLREIMSITPERVLEISKKYLKREDFVTLVVGDEEC